jgi:hypothetical protein
MASVRNKVGYGLSDALPVLAPTPIVALRAPTTNDINYALGTLWIEPKNTSSVAVNGAWVLTSVISNSATWESITGGSGSFTSLVVTPGPISLTGTTGINTSGAAVTTINTGGTGALNLGNATGNTAVTGSLSTTTSLSATTTVTGGTGVTATTGNIVATAGAVNAGTTMTAGTGLTVTLGNATLTNGNLVLSTAATYISLPGPVFIYSGAGAPSAGLALHVGDMYINTTAASATTRIYVATAASTWTNLTCAA